MSSIKTTYRDLAVECAVQYSSQLADDLHKGQTTTEQDGTYKPDETDTPEGSKSCQGADTSGRNSPALVSSSSTVQMPITYRPDARKWQCFAPISNTHTHLQASQLKAMGVWLGSMDYPDEVVTDRSYTEVLEDYYEATNRGVESLDNIEPISNKGRTSHQKSRVACASCIRSGRQPVEGVMVETRQLRHKKMHRSVSIPLVCSSHCLMI